MRYFILVLLILNITVLSSAKEYKFTKKCNPHILAEELEEAGIDLLGLDQIGSMRTSEGKKITVKIKDGHTIDEDVLNQIIADHQYKTPEELEAIKEADRQAKEDKIKQKLGLTNKDWKDLVEALDD